MSRLSAAERGDTNYSDVVRGDIGNHEFGMRVDVNACGYVGITQLEGGTFTDRVLLSPTQFRELVRFVRDERPR